VEKYQPSKSAADLGEANQNHANARWLEKVSPGVGIALACGIAEAAGRHLPEIGSALAQNPWSASGVGGAILGAAVVSRRGKAAIAWVLRRLTDFLEGKIM
jgi:hypothetical protein